MLYYIYIYIYIYIYQIHIYVYKIYIYIICIQRIFYMHLNNFYTWTKHCMFCIYIDVMDFRNSGVLEWYLHRALLHLCSFHPDLVRQTYKIRLYNLIQQVYMHPRIYWSSYNNKQIIHINFFDEIYKKMSWNTNKKGDVFFMGDYDMSFASLRTITLLLTVTLQKHCTGPAPLS